MAWLLIKQMLPLCLQIVCKWIAFFFSNLFVVPDYSPNASCKYFYWPLVHSEYEFEACLI